MADPAQTHPFFDCFMESRHNAAEPTDFDIILLNAILALTPATGMLEQAHTPDSSPALSMPSSSASSAPTTKAFFGYRSVALSCRPSAASGAAYTSDKLFPTPLLKCPLMVLTAFCKEHKLNPSLVSELHHARRRKKNRMFQRITRNRREDRADMKQATPESDDEGRCATIDSERVYAELVSAMPHAVLPAAAISRHQPHHLLREIDYTD